MNSRKYKSDINKLLEEGKAIMKSSEDAKYLMRVFTVNMVLSGSEVSEISEMVGVSDVTIYNWVKAVDNDGFEALRNKKIPGRPPGLNSEQLTAVDLAIQSDPNDYGFKTWDEPSLSEYIKTTFNINLGVRRCQELFHQLGFSHIRPQTFPSKGYADTEERTSFKKISDYEVNDSTIVVYQDEVHFQIQTTITAVWYKKGSAQKIKSFPGRQKVSYSGFVIPDTGELFISKPTTFNYKTTIESIRSFLVAHLVPKGKKYAIVMDNAPWHKKTIRLVETEKNPEYADILEHVIFVKLPPYSPDFNPIEQVWRITRRENTHNVFFPDIHTLSSTVDKAFEAWYAPNSQLAKLCSFKHS